MGIKIVNDTSLKSVADAIRAKSGISEPLEYPDGFVSAIEDIPTGGGGGSAVPEKQVNFYDYDGTCVYSYTPSEFAALTELPANPSHEGLTAQGWNWSLSDAKTYVAEYGMLNVGQMYITDDGKTRVYIHLDQGRTSPMLGVCPDGAVDVDWGDGTEHDTLTGTSTSTVKWTPKHNYAAPGDYVIKLTVDGSMGFYENAAILRYTSSITDNRNTAYRNSIRAIEIGNFVNSIATDAFHGIASITSIAIPSGVTSIGSMAFYACHGLTSIVIPNGVTSIRDSNFDSCFGLVRVIIPNGVTSIGSKAFYSDPVLTSIVLPSGVTSIGSQAFYNSASLSRIVLPSGVTSIDSQAFAYCNTGELHFKSTTPPTVSNSNVFYNFAADCKIYVPTGSLEAYTSATNYPSSSIYTYIEE